MRKVFDDGTPVSRPMRDNPRRACRRKVERTFKAWARSLAWEE